MAQRISRAKQSIRAAGGGFEMPPEPERAERLRVVLHVLYLMFNEGYIASSGPDLQRGELTREAIRLTRAVHALLPDDGEVAGLLALMLLTDARRAARTGADGTLIALADQDRSRWNRGLHRRGHGAHHRPRSRTPPSAPTSCRRRSPPSTTRRRRAQDTDWPQILALYELLARVAPNPMVTLNHAVAVAMVDGPRAGLELLATLDGDERLAGHHRLDAVRAHLLEMAGDHGAARAGYRAAARRTTSLPEQRYLEARAARLDGGAGPGVRLTPSGARISFHSRISQPRTTPLSTNGSPSTNASAAARVGKMPIEPCSCGSPKVPTMRISPRAWNSSRRAWWAGKCAGARLRTSSADS